MAARDRFEESVANAIRKASREYGLTPAFYPMHTFVVGNDDRDFYRRFIATYFQNEDVHIEDKPSSVDSIVSAMQTARFNLCMRYHSVVFAHTLGVGYTAIDYTNGGKIHGFLSGHDALDRCARTAIACRRE